MNPASSIIEPNAHRKTESSFYIGMAILAIMIAIAGFGPTAINTASRREPMTLALAAHGAIFGTWLMLFLTQTILISKKQISVHRQLGFAGVLLAILMVVSGILTAIAMARRGYDLSGDLIQGTNDPLVLLALQLGDLLSFSILVGFAVWYRKNHHVHKRLMLLATVGALMPAALTHIIGHSSILREITAPIIIIPLFLLLFSSAIYDRLTRGKIHPVSLWVALALFLWSNLRAVAIGPSEAWQDFAKWLIQ